MLAPKHCTNMADVRSGVDDIDRKLAALIATRFAFMDAAARIKPDRSAVRDEARKAEVIANARAHALQQGFPPEAAAQIWETLVEASIAYEFAAFDAR
jgi:isochorismate pyruvate lyase